MIGDSSIEISLFPFSHYWWFYAAFTGFVPLLLTLDVGVFHRKAHEVSIKEATTWTVIWIAMALVFNLALYQHRILFYGIIGALIFRSIFISAGSILMQYHWVVLLFGIFLVLTGVKMLFAPENKMDPDKNPLVRLFRKLVPVTPEIHEQKFFVRIKGILHATPLMVALVFVEATDIIFAVDSVPAIFALTSEPIVVFTSNIFAMLGLRALYFVLAGAMDKFHLLKYGLALVLIFVGLKMAWLNSLFGGKFPVTLSLAIITGIIGVSVALSLWFPRKSEEITTKTGTPPK